MRRPKHKTTKVLREAIRIEQLPPMVFIRAEQQGLLHPKKRKRVLEQEVGPLKTFSLVMESYQTWFGEGPELSILRMLGLFDRPVDEKVLGVLLKSPAIPGLTESLTELSPSEWRTILARLRRARLLTGEDPHNPGYLDTHPLVREYFGEQLRSHEAEAWKECNRRLYSHYRTLAPHLPDSFKDMEPLFLAVIYGCNAGLYRDALHEVYMTTAPCWPAS